MELNRCLRSWAKLRVISSGWIVPSRGNFKISDLDIYLDQKELPCRSTPPDSLKGLFQVKRKSIACQFFLPHFVTAFVAVWLEVC